MFRRSWLKGRADATDDGRLHRADFARTLPPFLFVSALVIPPIFGFVRSPTSVREKSFPLQEVRYIQLLVLALEAKE